MAIYIKDMEMPESCWGCVLDKKVNCAISLGEESSSNFRNIRHPDCPLVYIPEPHGRLIDADELVSNMKLFYRDVLYIISSEEAISWVEDDAPTVIKGSE